MNKPILVTGGAGFIGSHIVDLFDKKNIDYMVLDNLSAGSIANIPTAVSRNQFIEGDVKDHELIKKLINSSSMVIHLASIVGVKNVLANPLETIETNINSLKQIAYHCSLEKIPLIYFSTSLVYSSTVEKKDLFNEELELHGLGLHPVSIYVTTKKTGELICEYYRERMGLQYIIIRPFNLIGVRQKSESGMVVPSFVKSALESNTINIYGNGQQSRTFSDVKTAVKLFWELINKKNTYNKIYNLATTENPVTILELAKKIKNLLHNNIQINFIPISEIYGSSYRDVEFRLPSLAKLKKVVQVWEEKKLEEILTEIINDEKLKLVLNIS
jgi:UDP-glucose 4-epimerase